MTDQSLEVLFEDNHLLVVNKPPLLPTMGVAAGADSLVVRAKRYLADKYNKPGKVFLGVVSRLDSFVSGVIVLARTSKSASRLSEQFRQSSVKKTYWAIVPGGWNNRSGTLRHWVYKDDQARRMRAERYSEDNPQPSSPEYKLAELNYRQIGESDSGHGLFEIDLITGRKHQIRVQLSASGFPIVGDRKYGSSEAFPHGIALHAKELQLVHPTRKTVMRFSSDPPKWWRIGRFKI